MATKAERFKVRAQRAAQNKKPKRPGRKAALRAQRSRERARAKLVEQHDRPTPRVPHNTAPRIGYEGTYELEATATGRPPRKSTRKSPRHLKPDTTLRRRAHERALSPEARSGRRARRRRAVKRIVRGEEE
jgi:hypothetical protein